MRFADDYVAGFERREDAEQFLVDLRERFAKFALELHPEKTRLIEFGRFAAPNRARRGERKPETFTLLGFTHICAKDRHGRFKLRRVTSKKKMHASSHRSRPRCADGCITRSPNRDAGSPESCKGTTTTTQCPTTARRYALSDDGSSGTGEGRLRVAARRPDHLAADGQPRRAMATGTPHPSPLAQPALRRQNPREEPSALTRTLGSVRGAVGNGGPYRD